MTVLWVFSLYWFKMKPKIKPVLLCDIWQVLFLKQCRFKNLRIQHTSVSTSNFSQTFLILLLVFVTHFWVYNLFEFEINILKIRFTFILLNCEHELNIPVITTVEWMVQSNFKSADKRLLPCFKSILNILHSNYL